MLIFLILLHLQSSLGFRGPHHPHSSVSHHHHHYEPQGDIKLTQDAQLLHDTAHLAEDMEQNGEHLDLNEMSDDELDFHYFKSHDTDNNTKLDGLEIFHAVYHTFHEHEETNKDPIPVIVQLIDRVLREDDLNNDGYLAYTEYVLSRQRSIEENNIENQKNFKLDKKNK